jgi:hypothetical protein
MLSLHLTLFHFRILDSHFTFLLGDFIILKILDLLHTISPYADAIKAPITLHTWQKSDSTWKYKRCTKLQSIVAWNDKSLQWGSSNEVHVELEDGLDAVGGVLVAGVQRLDGGEALGVLVLAGASDDGDVGLWRGHPVDPEEAERVAVRRLGPLEHGREHDGLAGAVLRAGDVEPLRPADDPGADLVALGELVVDDGGGAEEEVLERDAGREVPGVDVGDVLVAAVDGVAVVLDEGAGAAAAAEARDVGDVVAVDEVGGALRQRHRALDREDVGVGARERELPVGRRARHHAGHDAPRRLRAPEDVVHEERQRVVARGSRSASTCVRRCSATAGSSCIARRGGTSDRCPRRARRCGWAGRWRHHRRISGGFCGGGKRVGRQGSLRWSRGLLVEDAAGERAVRHGKREQKVERRPDGVHRVPGHDAGWNVTGRDR